MELDAHMNRKKTRPGEEQCCLKCMRLRVHACDYAALVALAFSQEVVAGLLQVGKLVLQDLHLSSTWPNRLLGKVHLLPMCCL